MSPKDLTPAHAGHGRDRGTHSILNPADHPNPAKKGVGFNPGQATGDLKHDYESSDRKGHLKKKAHEFDELDLSGIHGKRVFCKHLASSISPTSTILSMSGRFPVSHSTIQDGTFEYQSSCASMSVLHFNVTTCTLFYALIVGVYNVTVITLDIPPLLFRPNNRSMYAIQRTFDKALVRRNMIPLIIVFTASLQACLSSIFFTMKHHYLAHIFSFLSKSAHTLHMDLAGNVKNISIQSSAIYFGVTCFLILFSSLKFGPSATSLPMMFGSLMLRLFLGSRLWLEPNSSLKISVEFVGGIFLLVIYTASVAPMLLFIYKCKIVRNGFASWNGRVYCALLRGFEFAQTEEARTTYNLLFKDHCVLLDLADSIDQMYSFTIESFFGLQIVSLFFQIYFFFRVGSEEPALDPDIHIINNEKLVEKKYFYIRPYDWIPVLLVMLSTSLLLLSSGKAAVEVAEEAQAGVEVLRRKGMIGRKTDQELEFMFSMSHSFESNKKIEITGAGYLYYNKSFIILAFAGAVFFFLLLTQYHPLMDHSPRIYANDGLGKAIKILEGNTYDHPGFTWKNGTLWRIGEI